MRGLTGLTSSVTDTLGLQPVSNTTCESCKYESFQTCTQHTREKVEVRGNLSPICHQAAHFPVSKRQHYFRNPPPGPAVCATYWLCTADTKSRSLQHSARALGQSPLQPSTSLPQQIEFSTFRLDPLTSNLEFFSFLIHLNYISVLRKEEKTSKLAVWEETPVSRLVYTALSLVGNPFTC